MTTKKKKPAPPVVLTPEAPPTLTKHEPSSAPAALGRRVTLFVSQKQHNRMLRHCGAFLFVLGSDVVSSGGENIDNPDNLPCNTSAFIREAIEQFCELLESETPFTTIAPRIQILRDKLSQSRRSNYPK